MAQEKEQMTPPSVAGMIDLGYEAPDYSQPIAAGEKSKSKTHTVYPTFRVCEGPAAQLHQALSQGRLLDGEFAAIVVLKNTMIRVADEDEDADSDKDVEMEFRVQSIMPHMEESGMEDQIMNEFDQLPKAKLHNDSAAEAQEHDDNEEEDEY